MSTNEVEAMKFFDEVVGDNDPHKVQTEAEIMLEAANGAELEVGIEAVERSYAVNKLKELPQQMLAELAEADVEEGDDIDPEEAPTETMATISGDAITAFEELCAEAMTHPDLTTHHFEQMVRKLDLEILFEIGALVLEVSLEDDSGITGFRTLD